MSRNLLISVALAVMLLAVSCTDKRGPSGEKPLKAGMDPIDAVFMEQDSLNIPYWAKGRWKSMILVRLAGSDGTKPVSAAALASIRDMASGGDYNALAAAGDPASGDNLYGPSNVVYVAHALGIIKEVWWVVPSFTSLDVEMLAYFKSHLKGIYPEDSSEIDGIKLDGRMATGTLNGVPVKMVCLEDLTAPGEPVLMDVDASIFRALYKNEKETSSLAFIAGMFKLLSNSGVNTYSVTVSASGLGEAGSLRFRSFSRYMVRLFNDPGLIDQKPPALWTDRAEAWRMEQKSPKVAVALYKRLIERYPDDASSRYDLADLYFSLGEYGDCLRELKEAVVLDPAYGTAFGEYADILTKDGKPKKAEAFKTASAATKR